jgi:hypothetical protein
MQFGERKKIVKERRRAIMMHNRQHASILGSLNYFIIEKGTFLWIQ